MYIDSEKACIFTARQRSCGKVMFLQVSVCHSVQGAPHVKINHDVLDPTIYIPNLDSVLTAHNITSCIITWYTA